MLVAGIDGGQSGSRSVLADEGAKVLARIDDAPLFARAEADATLGARIGTVLERLRSAAGLDAGTTLDAVVAGLSGQDEPLDLTRAGLGARRARAVHDSEVAHAGALAGEPGIVVVAGSGSVAFGTDTERRRVRRGGWGATFGDEGGAVWIGRRAVSAAMRAMDAGAPTRLEPAVCAFFGVTTLHDLQRRALRGELSQETLGAFAPIALALAEHDDVARRVCGDAAAALVELTVEVDRALERRPARAVSWAGKVFECEPLRAAWSAAVAAALERPHVQAPRAEPVVGALLLALRDAGA